ncbi:mechanosensitive ion channel domain-containing protein [Pseudovibrio sp. SPO723]|uniref:mechanosensitive ion channel domain-containing protein n=1 Tax=Nesiotobacter zosterae TaxID=392721 RepID=UPI0029C4F34A|nr:mechanosensitive ion channel domain-containing protein [Pseudovibrio sp. SPO723]MDX5595381.1 mechanosensitive ion channel [Pseudovibrio sp. SPO723]
MFAVRTFLSLLAVLFVVAGPVSAQQTPASPDPVTEQQAVPADDGAAVEALIKVLQDPAQRDSLIKFLEQNAGTGEATGQGTAPATDGSNAQPATGARAASGTNGTAGAAADTGTPAADAEGSTPSENVGQVTTSLVAAVGESVRKFGAELWDILLRIWSGLSGYERIVENPRDVDPDRFVDGFLGLLSVLVPGYVALMIMRRGSLRLFSSIQKRYAAGNWFHRSGYLLFSTGIEVVSVFIASGLAYFVSIAITPNTDPFVFNRVEALTLNAFFLVEMSRVALRFVFAPYRPKFRVLPFSDSEARYWSRKLAYVLIGFGYGVSVFVPLVMLNWSYSLGTSIRLTVVLLSVIYLAVIIIRSRARVQAEIEDFTEARITSEIARSLMVLLSYTWHILALLYIWAIFLVWLSRPYQATQEIFYASAYTLTILILATFATVGVSKSIRRGVNLSPRLARKLPTMESRLNASVPALLSILRVAIVGGALLGILEVWGIGAFWSWILSGEGSEFGSRVTSAVIVLLVGFLIWVIAMSWIDLRLTDAGGPMITSRRRTLFKLFSNALTILLVVMFVLLAMSELGVNIGPLIAGAGVFGLAVSFGSQKLVQDVINGAFIQVENAMNEGDYVTVGGVSGTVERLTIRSVRLRDLEGITHTIPFSAVDTVSNATRDYSYALAVVGVSYDTDINLAKEAMHDAFKKLRDTPNGAVILEDLDMQGVIAFGASSVDIRARIKTLPGSQWAIGRAYNEHIKRVFDERGIEIPFPQVTYHYAEDAEKKDKPKPLPATGKKESAPKAAAAKDAPIKTGKPRVPNEALPTEVDADADGDGSR